MLYKGGCFMQTSRDIPESSTEVNKVYIPGQRRTTTSKAVRSHNKDETATRSAQGHYIIREGSSHSKKRGDSFLGPDTDYQYKYVSLGKEEQDEEDNTNDDGGIIQPPPPLDEIQTFIRLQRSKIKFKFALDDYCLISNCLQKLNGPLSEMIIMKMMKRKLDRAEPGPLMEKRVFINEKLQYYIKRY